MRLRFSLGMVAGLCLCTAALAHGGKNATLTDAELYDHIYGGWLGQAIGVTLGGPWEFRVPWPAPEISYYQDLPEACSDQDDIYVELVSLLALEQKGPAFTCKDIGALWPTYFRPEIIWAANRAAYENIVNGVTPPESGHPAWNDSWDAIDAQIEADVFGLACPAMVNVAARAGLEGSHVTNWGRGSHGAVFVAACYAAAFTETDIDCVVRDALATIPPESEYATMVRLIRSWRRAGVTWQEARERLSRVYEPQHAAISAMINSGAVVIALLWGEGDFERTIQIGTMCGWDSDCNPSTAGGIVGCMIGASRIPPRWRDPIGDRYLNRWAMPALGKDEFTFTELAERTRKVAERFLRAHGATVSESATGERAWVIPLEAPRPVPAEEASPAQIAQWRMGRYAKLASRFMPGWTLTDCGTDMGPGLRPYLGRERVLMTHPWDRQTSAKLSCTVRRAGAGPAALTLTVSSYDGDVASANWLLRVRAGDQILLEQPIDRIDGKPQWQTFVVDLTRPLAQDDELTLTVENVPTDWSFEAGYFADLRVTGAEVVR